MKSESNEQAREKDSRAAREAQGDVTDLTTRSREHAIALLRELFETTAVAPQR